MSGRYFYIQSALNSMVLDLSSNRAFPGNKVLMQPLHRGDNQLWYHDVIYNTIRSKVNDDFVLDINANNRLVVNEFNPSVPNQRWVINKDRIMNLEIEKVLDISGGKKSAGAEVCLWQWKGQNHQIFSIHYIEPREFLIVSKMHGKALNVKEGKRDPGTLVVMQDRHGRENQVWYESREGFIHSKMNGFVLSSDGNNFQIQPYDARWDRQWIKLGSKILNRLEPDKVADIQASNRKKGANVVPYNFHGKNNQLWEYQWI